MAYRIAFGLSIIGGICCTLCGGSGEFAFTYVENAENSLERLNNLQQSDERYKINQLTLIVSNFRLTSEFLASFPHLKQLFMFNFYRSVNVTVADDSFVDSPQLEKIYLEKIDRSRSSLPNLSLSKSLQHLMLFESDLRSSVNGDQLAGTDLRVLVVSGSPSVTLDDDTFYETDQILSIDIYKCAQTELPESIAALKRLITLRFSDCKLRTFSGDNVGDSRSILQVLDLSGNQLSDLAPNTFENMTELGTLLLARNRLSRIHSDWFGDTTNLSMLDLNSNLIAGLPSGVFSPLTNLRSLTFSDNQIDSLDNLGLEAAESTLFLLDASQNRINRLRVPKFTNKLTLDLRHNRIKTIDQGSFTERSIFSNIKFEGNPTDRIVDGAFAYVSFNGIFSLDNITMTQFSIGVLDRIRSIYKFSLYHNPNLVSITESSLTRLSLPSELKEIEFNQNPQLEFDDKNAFFNRLSITKGLTFRFRDSVKCGCFWLNRFGTKSSIFNISNWDSATCSNFDNIRVAQFVDQINNTCSCGSVDNESQTLCSGTPLLKFFFRLPTMITAFCFLFVVSLN